MLERIRQLCVEHGTNLSQLEKALGFANGSLAKSDEKIQSVRLKAIADYFGVTVDWLLTGEEGYYTNAETAKLAQEMFEDKEMRALFDMKRNMNPEVFRAHYDMMKKLYELENPTNETGC